MRFSAHLPPHVGQTGIDETQEPPIIPRVPIKSHDYQHHRADSFDAGVHKVESRALAAISAKNPDCYCGREKHTHYQYSDSDY